MNESPSFGLKSKSSLNYNEYDKVSTRDGVSYSLLRFINTLVRMLRSSEGRNKLCGFVQYISKFSAACIIYTIDTNEIKTNLNNIEMIYDRHSNLKRIEKSMSNGRKIFRFMKFAEDLKKFYSYLLESSFDPITILKAFTTLSGCFYHFLDNLVWASNVGMINEIISGDLKWKTSKNFFSLLKTIIKLITKLLDFKNYYFNSWINNEHEIKNENYEKILYETFKNRYKLRMLTLDILQMLLKLITIVYSLKLEPYYNILHPIIVTFCGIVYCVISLIKIFLKTSHNQQKMVKSIKLMEDNYIRSSTGNLFNLGSNQSNSNVISAFTRCRKSSFECSLVERPPNERIFEENYFENYYIDFNKDYPTTPEMVLKANGGDFLKFIY